MGLPKAMPPVPNPETRARLQSEIEDFVRSLEHPIVVEDGVELFDLTAARWRLNAEFAKLMLEVWNPRRSIARRVEGIAYRDRARLGIFVRKPGGGETGALEFRELRSPARDSRNQGRARFRGELLAALSREFSGWRFERTSIRSDREHSFSAWYTRGVARQGRAAWAFLGLGEEESAAADSVLAFGLIWLDWLRSRTERESISGLKLFLPRGAIEVTAHRATCLNRRAVQLEIFEWHAGAFSRVELKDFGNVATHLVPCRHDEPLAKHHRENLNNWLGEFAPRVDVVRETGFLSLRVLGLEIARLEGMLAPRAFWGLEGSYRRLEENNREESRKFIRQVLERRSPESPEPAHDYYRLQAERWLESLLVRDLNKIDPALSNSPVYPQVPAVSGSQRGVIDVLGITRAGRLAVVELKLHEAINLPFQGLDYWLRVKWLHKRGEFRAAGYFRGVELSASQPLLYLVSPAFRFHSSTDKILRYLDPCIEIIQVGLNDGWRERVQVLFRRDARGDQ